MSRAATSYGTCRVRLSAKPHAALLCLLLGGCTSLQDWIQNGFKVGPNFQQPTSSVATAWIDAQDARVQQTPLDEDWWRVFQDQALVSLIETARKDNLDLKTTATRVLQAEAQRNIAAGNLLPQTQRAFDTYVHGQISRNLNVFNTPFAALPNTLNVWATGFNASWELDLWGRLRRAIESADADLEASVESYHDALVTLVADTATAYVQIRTQQERIAQARRNIDTQMGSLRLAEVRLKEGRGTSVDVEQARLNLAQTQASLPPLTIGMRQANNRLCLLLGVPPEELLLTVREAPIPSAPAEVAIGLPAELLERRPDVRQALRKVASQSAQIGVAIADLYPQFGVQGFIGYAASDIRYLFEQKSFTAFIIPTLQWKILNYGRIVNNIRVQDARFQENVFQYQQTVLRAGKEVEDALVAFLQYQVQAKRLAEAVTAAERNLQLLLAQYGAGRIDFNPVFTAQGVLASQHDQLAVARGNVAVSLISLYRALGGGWKVFERTPREVECTLDSPVLTPPN